MNEQENETKTDLAEQGETTMDSSKKNEKNWTEEQVNELKNEEKKPMENKVLYEIRFVETEDGYRLIAKGDKKGLRRMGFGPMSMLGAGRRVRHDRGRGRHMRRMRARRAAMHGEHGGHGGHGRGRWGEGPVADEQAL